MFSVYGTVKPFCLGSFSVVLYNLFTEKINQVDNRKGLFRRFFLFLKAVLRNVQGVHRNIVHCLLCISLHCHCVINIFEKKNAFF